MGKLPFEHALVTGGAGFIGSHLVDAIVDAGSRVTVLDNLSTGRRGNLNRSGKRITFVQGDIRDRDLVMDLSRRCQVVFHLAAVVSVPQTVEDPLASAWINEMGTLTVLEAARLNGAKRVVLSSSCAVYGDGPQLPKQEVLPPKPQSPYALQKLAGESYAALYTELYGLGTVCLRYFNVYGPRQDPASPYSGVISIFMKRAAAGETPRIHGDGRQYRDFVYVTDVVAANLLAASVEASDGKVFNIGTGRFVRIQRLWKMIQEISGCRVAPEFRPERPGDIRESVADIGYARSVLGFEPCFGFEEGLTRTYDWYRNTES
ncbi:UDP-glucose 4-epimerase (EC [Olavius algarvensis associated proteobacterium Delta 3]|nr:UDP-glucose 4-epimerase (EC [Olavius algarvensis associated proteobacterium Delta 3]CAB5147708.1 UDP-glucose 4-epimerase (EC [Olavius algarvensis associated proteobacterium Delta 3]